MSFETQAMCQHKPKTHGIQEISNYENAHKVEDADAYVIDAFLSCCFRQQKNVVSSYNLLCLIQKLGINGQEAKV